MPDTEAMVMVRASLDRLDRKIDESRVELRQEIKETQRLQRITNGQVVDHARRITTLEDKDQQGLDAHRRWKDHMIAAFVSAALVIFAAVLADLQPFH